MIVQLRPEYSLLVRCTRLELMPDDVRHVRNLLAQPLDWPMLVAVGAEHGVLSMLSRHVDAVDAGAVPPDVLAALRATSLHIAARNAAKARELVEAMDRFAAAGIPAIPFKGPMVALGVYGNLALRTFNDLDIVVPERHVPTALQLLLNVGYRLNHVQSLEQGRATFGMQRHYPLVRDWDAGFIELHWAFTSRHHGFALDPEDAIARADAITIAGRSIPTLAREDMLLVLCRHGANHRWADLELICSPAEILRAGGLDWDLLLRRAAQLHGRRTLLLGLRLARDLLGAPLPNEISRTIDVDRTVTGLTGWIRDRLFRDPVATGRTADAIQTQRYSLACEERSRDKVRYVYNTATVPTLADLRTLRLPGALAPLYFGVRPLRLMSKYVQQLLGSRS